MNKEKPPEIHIITSNRYEALESASIEQEVEMYSIRQEVLDQTLSCKTTIF